MGIDAPKSIDWDAFQAFVIRNLEPDRLLANLRQQRSQEPDYPFCYQYFWRFRSGDADKPGLDQNMDRIRAVPAVAAAVARIEAYGFSVRISTYDEPSGRDLFVGMKQDPAAEARMCETEGLI